MHAGQMNDKDSPFLPGTNPYPRHSASAKTFLFNHTIRPLYFVRHYALGKILTFIALLYLIILGSLYLFANDYYTTLPLSTPWNGFQWSLRPSGVSDRLDPGESGRILSQPDFDYGKAVDLTLDRKRAHKTEFKWSDWVDLRAVTKYRNVTRSSPNFPLSPYVEIRADSSLWEAPIRNASEIELAINGKMFLSRQTPQNMTVVVLGKKAGRYAVGNSTSDSELKTKFKAHPPLVPALQNPLQEKIRVDLDFDLFIFDAEKLKHPKPDATDLEIAHGKQIEDWTKAAPISEKYFEECYIHDDRYAYGNHYDWRFFDGVRKGEEHQAAMHHLIRTWNKFVDQEAIVSWIAHGSLLGWYWDGTAMPWDTDNDVQMPIMELDRFSQLYNQTIVVEDPAEGTGRYLIDVSPWYVQRVRGNGKNVIDARFIDIRSGIYLDVTGLAVTGTGIQTQRVNCKNHHYYAVNKLSPLRRSLYEGSQVYVPNDFERILSAEYKSYRSPSFGGWSFNRWLRLWVGRKKCDSFHDNSKKRDAEGRLTLYGACNDMAIWQEYNLTESITLLHSEEMNLYYDGLEWELPEINDSLESSQVDEQRKAQDAYKADTKVMMAALQTEKDPRPTTVERVASLLSKYYPPLRYDPA